MRDARAMRANLSIRPSVSGDLSSTNEKKTFSSSSSSFSSSSSSHLSFGSRSGRFARMNMRRRRRPQSVVAEGRFRGRKISIEG